MALPVENPYPQRDIFSNLRYSSTWDRFCQPHLVRLFQNTKHAHQVLVAQCVLYADCAARVCRVKKKSFTVSLIGCGQVGKKLLRALLDWGTKPENIFVATRQPELLNAFSSQGVRCGSDSEFALKRGRIVFLLCSFPALSRVGKCKRDSSENLVRANSILVSTLASTTCEKIRQVFRSSEPQTLRVAAHEVVTAVKRGRGISKERNSEKTSDSSTNNFICKTAADLLLCRDDLRKLHITLTNFALKLGMQESSHIAAIRAIFGPGFEASLLDSSNALEMSQITADVREELERHIACPNALAAEVISRT